MRYFELNTTTSISPGTGEDLGNALANAATAREQQLRDGPGAANVDHWSATIAQMLYLGADAFEAGASASIGHNRSDRYQQRAKELRTKADDLYAEGRKVHADKESATLVAAFDDGYAGRDISGHSFERREAALVGQLFAKEARGMPQRINKVYAPRPLGRDSDRDHLLVDGLKFVVDYPGGKVAEATVTELAA